VLVAALVAFGASTSPGIDPNPWTPSETQESFLETAATAISATAGRVRPVTTTGLLGRRSPDPETGQAGDRYFGEPSQMAIDRSTIRPIKWVSLIALRLAWQSRP